MLIPSCPILIYTEVDLDTSQAIYEGHTPDLDSCHAFEYGHSVYLQL